MDTQETALKAALLKVLRERLSAAKKTADGDIAAGWQVGDRNAAVLPDDTRLGTVTLADGKSTARLHDEDAYLAWVLENHPDEIEQVQVTRVNPGFTERLLSFARQTGDCINPATGEPVPGVSVAHGDPYPMVRLEPDAADLVAKAWQDGSLAELIGSLVRPALKAGES